ATWDHAGKSSISATNPPLVAAPAQTNTAPILSTDTSSTNISPIVSTNTSSTNITPVVSTNALPGANLTDYTTLALPPIGSNVLHVLTPTLLEVKFVNTKQPDPARVGQWDLVNSSGQFAPPSAGEFAVTVNGQTISVIAVGFKRRPLYAPLAAYDLR